MASLKNYAAVILTCFALAIDGTLASTPAIEPSITEAKPGQVDNGGASTLEITGEHFDRATTFQLLDAAKNALKAQAVYFENPAIVYATFDLANKAPGSYNVQAISSDGAAVQFAGTLTVTPVAPPSVTVPPNGALNGTLETYLTPPAETVPNSVGSFTVNYINIGGHDIAAPILNVTSPGKITPLGFKPDRVRSGIYLAFLAISPTDSAGILRPGESGSRTLYFQSGAAGTNNSLKLDVFQPNNSTPIDVAPYLLPSTRSDPNFAAILARIQQDVGNTWGGYDAVLAQSATLLPPVKGDHRDLLTLIDLEAVKATAAVSTSISGTIRAPNPTVPIAGQLIYASGLGKGYMTYSLNDGSFIFPEIIPGTYDMKYEGARDPVTFADTHPKAVLLKPQKTAVADGQAITGITLDLVESVTLNGQISSLATHALITEASIAAIGSTGITYPAKGDPSGQYRFPALPADTYLLVINAAGYARTFQPAVVLTSDAVTSNLTMAAESIITGTIAPGGSRETVEKPFGGMNRVVAKPVGVNDPNQIYDASLKNDSFSLNGLPAGNYNLSITKPGYISVNIENVAVGAGAVTDVGTVNLAIDPALINAPVL